MCFYLAIGCSISDGQVEPPKLVVEDHPMPLETVRSRVQKVLSGVMPSDRLPVIEWAPWWTLTLERWHSEGLPEELTNVQDVQHYFGLDPLYQQWFNQMLSSAKPKHEGTIAEETCWIEDETDYETLRPHLYPDPIQFDRVRWHNLALQHEAGDIAVWMTLEGFFWWPRVLFGVEPHLYAFYDQPELMHRINQDQVNYMLRAIEEFCAVCTPDFMTFAEDMSYNHGPMISEELFEEFMAPYYRQVIPVLKKHGIVPLIDSDGDIEPLIPWFQKVGFEGILPLERMAGVDVNRIRANHPTWKMIGAFDKTVMHCGEDRLREEFTRLLPVMRSGYFIPSVDHQTPPGVSLADYQLYRRFLEQYAELACQETTSV